MTARLAIAVLIALGGPTLARADVPLEPTVEANARIVYFYGDRIEDDWLDVHVRAPIDVALDRCQQIVRAQLRKKESGTPLRPRLERGCEASALARFGPIPEEPILLRTEETLPAAERFALGPSVRVRLVRYHRAVSADDCEQARASASASASPDHGHVTFTDSIEACVASMAPDERPAANDQPRAYYRPARARWAERERARERCLASQANHARPAHVPDPEATTRSCVRE